MRRNGDDGPDELVDEDRTGTSREVMARARWRDRVRIRRTACSVVTIAEHVADHVERNVELVSVDETDADGAEGGGLRIEGNDRPALHVMLTDTERDRYLRTGSREYTGAAESQTETPRGG